MGRSRRTVTQTGVSDRELDESPSGRRLRSNGQRQLRTRYRCARPSWTTTSQYGILSAWPRLPDSRCRWTTIWSRSARGGRARSTHLGGGGRGARPSREGAEPPPRGPRRTMAEQRLSRKTLRTLRTPPWPPGCTGAPTSALTEIAKRPLRLLPHSNCEPRCLFRRGPREDTTAAGKQGISIVHGGLGAAPNGRMIGSQPLKEVIWQGRNQGFHWAEQSFHPPVEKLLRGARQRRGSEVRRLHDSEHGGRCSRASGVAILRLFRSRPSTACLIGYCHRLDGIPPDA